MTVLNIDCCIIFDALMSNGDILSKPQDKTESRKGRKRESWQTSKPSFTANSEVRNTSMGLWDKQGSGMK